MIVGKNSSKKGFIWFFITILKVIVSVSTIAYISEYTVLGIIGIIALVFLGWEQLKEYRRIEKESRN